MRCSYKYIFCQAYAMAHGFLTFGHARCVHVCESAKVHGQVRVRMRAQQCHVHHAHAHSRAHVRACVRACVRTYARTQRGNCMLWLVQRGYCALFIDLPLHGVSFASPQSGGGWDHTSRVIIFLLHQFAFTRPVTSRQKCFYSACPQHRSFFSPFPVTVSWHSQAWSSC